ncbi:hypothetical protein BJ741DRAFT_712843 [Chytriomyces cf. hyalinus JEL632]|nr:hypothetical protein BJ741DRAFT_712843 [Chytriomyces cf. hyalinus JEL632]
MSDSEDISKKEEARKRRELKRREQDHEKRLRDERSARKRQEAAEEAARKVKRFKWTEEASLEVPAVYAQLKDEQLTLEQNKIGFTSFVKHVETNLSQCKLSYETLASIDDTTIMNRHRALCSTVKTIKDKCKQTGGGGFADSLDKHGISHRLFTAFDDSHGDHPAFQGDGEACSRTTLHQRITSQISQPPLDDEADDTSGYASDHSVVSNVQQPCENLINNIELHESDLPFNDDSDMSSGKLFDTNISSTSGIQRIDGTSTEVSGAGNLVAQRPDALVFSQTNLRVSSIRTSVSSTSHQAMSLTLLQTSPLTPRQTTPLTLVPVRPRALTAGAS